MLMSKNVNNDVSKDSPIMVIVLMSTLNWQVKGTAVGFMSVCANVDIDLLRSCFDLKPFNGLRKLQVETTPTSNRK